MTISLATSPKTLPPTPSATATRVSPAKTKSSLLSRTSPGCERAAASKRNRRRGCTQRLCPNHPGAAHLSRISFAGTGTILPVSKLVNFASILEDQTRAQAERTAALPIVWPHLALMPDAPLGKGATVGSVIPTVGAIIPAAVGVDIGCGMMAVRTQFDAADLTGQDLSGLPGQISRSS